MLRAKYARQIREGIVIAKAEVAFTIKHRHPPIGDRMIDQPELTQRAYKITIAKLVVREIVRVGESMVKKVHEKWPETDGDSA